MISIKKPIEKHSVYRNQKERYHDEQMVYLWELNHSKDIKESYTKDSLVQQKGKGVITS